MIRVKEAIVVEGRYDKAKLAGLVALAFFGTGRNCGTCGSWPKPGD